MTLEKLLMAYASIFFNLAIMIHKMPIIDFEKVKETRKDIYETT
jgi:hypothetical protein